jgi:two-component system, cell cycle sensor histidine kinase and response regulator CckA
MSGPPTHQDDVFRDLVDNLRAVFWVVAPDGATIVYCSPAYEELWGRSVASLYADPRGWLEAIHPDDRPRVAAAWERAPDGYDVEYRVRRPDGLVTHVHDRGHPVRADDGTLLRIVGIATDITDVKRLEEQLQHAEKMDSLGRLAGGVAHEVNNLLTIVLGQARLVRERPDEAAARVAVIEETARRGGDLTARLLGLTRSQPIRAGTLDLGALARDQAPLLLELVGPSIRLECRLEAEPWPVRADAEQIRRLVTALASNGADAMPAGGTLTISTANAIYDELDAGRHPGLAPGEHVVLTVADTGAGIRRADLSRVFEPYFSTKRRAGAGMGLPTCYGIVTRAGGHIRIESEPGGGTRVVCAFPRADAAAPASAATPAASAGGRETVLVAEDEPMVREIVAGVLREQGYDVLEAGDGEEALAAVAGGPPIALLVTDVVMPRMGGRELGERLRAQWPWLRILFVSGYTDGALGDAGDHATAFLPKPFMSAELADAARALLD